MLFKGFSQKKALICLMVEKIGISIFSKIKIRIRINLVTPLNVGLFHGHNTYCVWGRGKAFLPHNKVKDFLENRFI